MRPGRVPREPFGEKGVLRGVGVRVVRDHSGMLLTRPARAARASVDERVRRAILGKAQSMYLSPDRVVNAHLEREYLADQASLLADVEERYGLPCEALKRRVLGRARRIVDSGRYDGRVSALATDEVKGNAVLREEGSELVLLVLPDEEFLAAIEHTATELAADRRNRGLADRLMRYSDAALAAHGLPYCKHPKERRFEWTGDPGVREQTVLPALHMLADPRLGGARAEFEESLGRRRAGGLKNYEDAIDEAAKSVESVLKVLIGARGLDMPSRQGARSLFNKLTENGVLPGELQSLASAAADLRNHSAAHGQGATVRNVPPGLADAAIGSAATAVTLLARYLP